MSIFVTGIAHASEWSLLKSESFICTSSSKFYWVSYVSLKNGAQKKIVTNKDDGFLSFKNVTLMSKYNVNAEHIRTSSGEVVVYATHLFEFLGRNTDITILPNGKFDFYIVHTYMNNEKIQSISSFGELKYEFVFDLNDPIEIQGDLQVHKKPCADVIK
ncbi:hypothetical protein ACFIQF_20655 [Comamonas sp. J-3]|uniref:hypothetical protein n=1 Tax=Comamonas trifloxystrobinivorans TaxID=3350256 RepID=UPI0037264142